MNRIEGLENVLRSVRESASAVDQQAIDAALAATTTPQDFFPDLGEEVAPYAWLHENMTLTTNRGRAEQFQAAGESLTKLYDGNALAAVQGERIQLEQTITYLHQRMVMFKSLYEGTQAPASYNPCNCGFTGSLMHEHCGKDGSAFAVRCPSCNKSVQSFSDSGLPGNWNAVNRKHARSAEAVTDVEV